MGFRNSVVRGIRLVREAIQSPDYEPGVEGWTINKDGTSEFGNATIRGTIVSGPLTGSHIIIEPSVAVGFNNGVLEAVIRMFPDDPNFMMEGMLGVVTFDAGQTDAQMSTVLHSPVPMTTGFGLVLAADSDDMMIPANGSLGVVTVDGDAMTFTPVVMVETYGAASRTFLTYGEQAGQTIEAFGSPGVVAWTAPIGVTSVKVECWGGGGSGGIPGSGGGGGGGGAEYASHTVAVTPGNVYNLTVGLGSTNVANGGDSIFPGDAVTVRAHGGVTSNNAIGAAGGSGSTNTIHHNGGHGSNGSTTTGGGGGGAAGTTAIGGSTADRNAGIGGATGGGNGGGGGLNNGRAGQNGVQPGGGGGGVGAGTSPTSGNGGNGVVRLTYSIPVTGIVASMSGDAGTDRFGNNYEAGVYQGGHRVLDDSRVRAYSCALTVNLALSAAGYADLVGMSESFDTTQDNAECTVTATFDTNCTAAGAAGDLAIYQLLLDGVPVSAYTPYSDIRTIRRELVPGTWTFTVPLAGSHILQFQGRKNAGVATVSALTSVTAASIVVVDNHGGV